MIKKKVPEGLLEHMAAISKFEISDFVKAMYVDGNPEASVKKYIEQLEELQVRAASDGYDIDTIPSILDKLREAQALIVMQSNDTKGNVFH